jgi:hypothetical protein
MMKWPSLLARAAALTSGLVGCAGSAPGPSDTFPSQSLFELLSDSGAQRVEVRTAPDQPPTRGNVTMRLSITDAATDAAETGLELKVVPWMPAMGHGTSVTPTIVETAPGIYDLENLILFMPGTWQIRTQWGAAVGTHVTPTLDVR